MLSLKKKVPKIKKIFDIRAVFYDIVKWTGALGVVVWFRMKRLYPNGRKQKKKYKGPFIIVGNHLSYTDPIVVCASFPSRRVGFLATDYLFRKKVARWFFSHVGCVPISHENVAVSSFKKASDWLNRGHCLTVFPEGGIERDEKINRFQSGAIMISVLTGAPIVPVYIVKLEKKLSRRRIVIGDLIETRELIQSDFPTVEDMQKAAEKLQSIEIELEKYSINHR